ncbi:MAG: ABC-F family ATP-binding cassette domain-containing protein [Tannerellaceae bacterium]|jgi:ATP-binding cassette subfamily F protein uup|nr:ABC-F family ATP-binding cassette domain-containing protein [Tannerellaceae bacterium]
MAGCLQIERLTKRFGSLLLLDDISFGVAQGEKIGLIAPNGSGKTTLLNIIAGREDYDSGSVVFRSGLRTGYLEQSPAYPPGLTVMQAMNAGENELKAKQILTQLNITDLEKKVGELSGGQLKRMVLAGVLITEPELILLDEPTNHLDLEMTEWIEAYLSRQNISILMVTHDRYFLDRVCNEIIEINRRQIYRYKGNYSYYIEKRQERTEAQNADLERVNNLLRKELEWIRRQPQARGTKARYRVDAFHRLEEKARQGAAVNAAGVTLGVKSAYIGFKIFEAVEVSKCFGDIRITDKFSYTFARHEKMGIAGNNGTGKSTFVKMLMGEIAPDSGHFDIGQTVRFGYYSQDGLQFDDAMRVIDVVQDIAEYVDMGDGRKLGVSQFLNHFLFPPDKQHDYVSKLSGGEKRRLYLCTVLMRNPNFLILDEPTNDLDIVTLNILEEYLCSFRGCVIVISHDRYFMDKVIDHLLVFRGDAVIKDFPGNYTRYREWKEEQDRSEKEGAATRREKAPSSPTPRSETRRLTFKERREVEDLEAGIALLEAEKDTLETSLGNGSLSTARIIDASHRIAILIEEIETKTARWFELADNNPM